MVKFYGLKQCSTCKKVLKQLKEMGQIIDQEVDIRQNPPSIEELMRVYSSQGGFIRSMMNSSGQLYREMGLKDRLDRMSLEEIFDLLHHEGMLIKRPLIVDETRGSAGSNSDLIQTIWGDDD